MRYEECLRCEEECGVTRSAVGEECGVRRSAV